MIVKLGCVEPVTIAAVMEQNLNQETLFPLYSLLFVCVHVLVQAQAIRNSAGDTRGNEPYGTLYDHSSAAVRDPATK